MIEITQITAYSTLFIMHELKNVVLVSKAVTQTWRDVDTVGLSKLINSCRDHTMNFIAEHPLYSQYNIAPNVSIISASQLLGIIEQFGGTQDQPVKTKVTKKAERRDIDADDSSRDI